MKRIGSGNYFSPLLEAEAHTGALSALPGSRSGQTTAGGCTWLTGAHVRSRRAPWGATLACKLKLQRRRQLNFSSEARARARRTRKIARSMRSWPLGYYRRKELSALRAFIRCIGRRASKTNRRPMQMLCRWRRRTHNKSSRGPERARVASISISFLIQNLPRRFPLLFLFLSNFGPL